ncbi:MAG: benzoate/H(+) symporter BenE family transporter [Micrococcales bacterium]|nr:benzoate/H(+) symporter BenE family transporter [Micrococcales bacterium]
MPLRLPRSDLSQPVLAGVVGALAGFASSFALVLAGLRAVGATREEAASGLLALCLGQAIVALALTMRYRMPISVAWSTPGAALLVAARGTTGDYRSAVGAFLLCGVLLAITGAWPRLTRVMTSIPAPIASAMLAGILLPICLAPVIASFRMPLLALPAVLVWVVLWRLAPRWSTPGAVVAALVAILVAAGPTWADGATLVPTLRFTMPALDPLVVVGLGIPLYVVTMAGQNIPGFAVLTTFGYRAIPARAILVGTGIGTVATATFGGYAINLSALSAAIMAGPESHPDPARRWVATISSSVSYLLLGLAAGLVTALVAAGPPILVTAVAGLALLGALVQAITAALADAEHRIVAIATFLVVASGIALAGIGSAFWGLVVGGALLLVQRAGRRRGGAAPGAESEPDAAR